jgi:hypothetical protein
VAVVLQSSPESMALQMTPAMSQQCTAMLTFLRRYGWHDFSILTGQVAGHDYFINMMRDMTKEDGGYE